MSAPDSASIAPDTLSISPGSGEPSASEKAGDYMVGETKTGDYVVVARRYRPTAFDQLVGQHMSPGVVAGD